MACRDRRPLLSCKERREIKAEIGPADSRRVCRQYKQNLVFNFRRPDTRRCRLLATENRRLASMHRKA